MLKWTIVLLLLATVASLFSGWLYLVRDDGSKRHLLTILTLRVGLASLTLALIVWGLTTGELRLGAPW